MKVLVPNLWETLVRAVVYLVAWAGFWIEWIGGRMQGWAYSVRNWDRS